MLEALVPNWWSMSRSISGEGIYWIRGNTGNKRFWFVACIAFCPIDLFQDDKKEAGRSLLSRIPSTLMAQMR
jgi:hypothetical protein